jgi:hypothetical protein
MAASPINSEDEFEYKIRNSPGGIEESSSIDTFVIAFAATCIGFKMDFASLRVFAFSGPEEEFTKFVQDLPSQNSSVTVDAERPAGRGVSAHFSYKEQKFTILRFDDELMNNPMLSLLTIVAGVISVKSDDTSDTIRTRFQDMRAKFNTQPIAIYSEEPINIEGLAGVLDRNTRNFLTSLPAEVEQKKKR